MGNPESRAAQSFQSPQSQHSAGAHGAALLRQCQSLILAYFTIIYGTSRFNTLR